MHEPKQQLRDGLVFNAKDFVDSGGDLDTDEYPDLPFYDLTVIGYDGGQYDFCPLYDRDILLLPLFWRDRVMTARREEQQNQQARQC